jgi:N-acetylglucosaminyldiphosphoundecaprenol N-acetyl-beta-D-mannosaminyltransferase
MIFVLGKITSKFSELNKMEKAIFYADFYVLYSLYKEKIKLPKNIHLYYDSTLIWILLKYYFGYNVKKQISTNFQYDLLSELNEFNKKIFLFGDSPSILNKVISELNSSYSNIQLVGVENGYSYDTDAVVNKINKCLPDVLFVGLGVGRQEPWIIYNIDRIHVDKIISVGGWFQYLADKKRRAPKLLLDLHLEWFYKLLTEFKRVWKRYLLILPKFLTLIIIKKIELKLITNE